MAWFKKKEKKGETSGVPQLPEIPQLPELPEFPSAEPVSNSFADISPKRKWSREQDDFTEFSGGRNFEPRQEMPGQIPQLPSFPDGSLGNKFSQDTIKEAITGRKEEEVEADEFTGELSMMQKPLVRKDVYVPLQRTRAKEAEPIFIRIDKFEEGSRTFEEVRKKISEIENMFEDVKKVKEKEEKELSLWEEEIKQVKEKIEKIDKNIFSQVE